MTEPGIVFTKDWVVDFVLDVAGYTVNNDLLAGCVVEPSCGDGAFLSHIATRLCERAMRAGSLSVEALEPCVRAFDLDDDSVSASRMTIRRVLIRFGLSESDSKYLSDVWVSQGDFLMANVPAARWVVGNPPYVRSSLIPREQRKAYCELLPCVTMGSDLYVGFFEKGLEALTEDGALCFICSDRWLQNRYGSRLRAFVSKRYSLDVHVRMHGVSAFEDDVSAYPAISLIRRGAGRPIRYMECRPRFSLSDVPAAKSWIASGEGTYRSENASADVLRPLSGSGSIPLAAPEKLQLLGDLANRYPRLEDAGVKLGIGVASGCDEVYITEDPDLVVMTVNADRLDDVGRKRVISAREGRIRAVMADIGRQYRNTVFLQPLIDAAHIVPLKIELVIARDKGVIADLLQADRHGGRIIRSAGTALLELYLGYLSTLEQIAVVNKEYVFRPVFLSDLPDRR